jgi:hypothetical protein
MKNLPLIIGLIALCALKASLVWSVWCCVVGALALIGAVRVYWVWRHQAGQAA